MGYTHYYSYKFTDPRWPEVFGRTALDAKTIIEAAAVLTPPVEVVREYDRTDEPPEVTEGAIVFNGPGDLGHETFVIEAKPADYANYCASEWAFCKTARKPYDLVVCSVLLRLAFHGGDIVEVRSDGHWDSEWLHSANCWRGGGTKGLGARDFVATLFPNDPVVDLGERWQEAAVG